VVDLGTGLYIHMHVVVDLGLVHTDVCCGRSCTGSYIHMYVVVDLGLVRTDVCCGRSWIGSYRCVLW